MREYVKANVNRWIEKLPSNARQVELERLKGIEDESWWDNYRGTSGLRKWRMPKAPTKGGGGFFKFEKQ